MFKLMGKKIITQFYNHKISLSGLMLLVEYLTLSLLVATFIVANCLDPDQDRQNIRPDLNPNPFDSLIVQN